MQVLLMLLSVVAAVVPMVAALLVVWWLDRYSREPLWLVGLAFLWGGLGSVLLALIGSTIVDGGINVSVAMATWMSNLDLGWLMEASGPVLVAPLVEEPAKAFILLFIIRSRRFDNMTDGFVYGAAAGLGFGMTENLLYFWSVSASPAAWLETVVIRTLYSAIMHATATSIVGAALGFSRFRGPLWTVGGGLVGLIIAMMVHMLWNGVLVAGEMYGSGEYFMMFNLIVFPFEFLLTFFVFQLCLWDESRTIRFELEEEVRAGNLASGHPALLASWTNRSWPRWVPAGLDRDRYIATATALATRKAQVKLMGDRASHFYVDEIERLREQLKRLTDRGNNGHANP